MIGNILHADFKSVHNMTKKKLSYTKTIITFIVDKYDLTFRHEGK